MRSPTFRNWAGNQVCLPQQRLRPGSAEELAAIVERAADYGGRPHWGKLHFHSHRTLAPLYPEWDLFQRIRSELDPSGTFSNSYTDRVLGPVA